METELARLAKSFGIDLLYYAIMSNHFHLVLRSRPDVVAAWDDTEVARRWLMLCPKRKDQIGCAEVPNEYELNMIRNDPVRLREIRSRLSDISWWMRLLSQKFSKRANDDDMELGKFWQARYRAVRLLDETAILACAASVDLNPLQAAMAETDLVCLAPVGPELGLANTAAYDKLPQRIADISPEHFERVSLERSQEHQNQPDCRIGRTRAG